ncbi:SDR family NAD(P)-dependent oxidoreductase [Mycobacteroides abscessus]|uniref:SDR family NAD(P)-dependent oxidoreductase n=1 Tax=Mycobacteroides abscessus TaxID=36809 RepID=A0ABD7HIP3_9MYCO|nr:NAD(P)H-binding protein [Mycobacteroides abscessus]RIT32732.1 SDR family NAD(P)-dependent oxidoreductase [Mycobacteroides abscessus]
MGQQFNETVAVTGVTGALGSRIADGLAKRDVPQLLVARNPTGLPQLANAQHRGPAEYSDSASMRRALDGASTLVLISGHPTGRRLEEHASAVESALAVGVERVLYVSLLGAGPVATYRNARDHWLTEQFIAGTGVRHTIFRAGFYGATPAALADEDLVISGPGGAGQAAFVTHGDIAAVVAAVALDSTTEHDGETLEVTGPELLTLEQAVARIVTATGRPYRYQAETLEEAFSRRWKQGVDGNQIEAWISWYQAIARGDVSALTDVVERVTGHPATPIVRSDWWPEPNTAY